MALFETGLHKVFSKAIRYILARGRSNFVV
jgi:hypothetical protein